jgi:hypothetical protein
MFLIFFEVAVAMQIASFLVLVTHDGMASVCHIVCQTLLPEMND